MLLEKRFLVVQNILPVGLKVAVSIIVLAVGVVIFFELGASLEPVIVFVLVVVTFKNSSEICPR